MNLQKIAKLLTVFALIGTLAQGIAVAQTSTVFTHTFPRIEVPGMELAIANINTTSASVLVNFFNSDGTLAASSRFSLAAGSQAVFNDSSMPVGSFTGAAVVESATQLSVTASVNRSGTLENMPPSASSMELVIPFVRGGFSANTNVTVFNPSQQTAQVAVVLARSNGTLVTGASLTMGPGQSSDISLNSLPVSLESVTHILIRSLGSVFSNNKAVFAVATIKNFDAGNGLVRGDAAVVQGVPVGNLTSSARVPAFIRGFGFFTQLQVVNVSTLPQSVTISAFSTSDAALPAARNTITVSIPANGSFSGDVAALFDFYDQASGSIFVSGSAALSVVAVIGNDNNPSLAVLDQVEPGAANLAFQFRLVSRQSFYGLSLMNSNSADVGVTISFITNSGSTISRTQITLPARSHMIKTLSDLLPEAEGSGFLFVSSDLPLHARAVEGSTDGAVLSSLRFSPVTSGFRPNPQNRFLAVGTATVAGVPIPGATIRLVGPVSTSILTDAVGAFVFRDIPPGSYTLSIQMVGITFTPASISFSITNENSRGHNFVGTIVGSTLTSLVPNSVLVGSPNSILMTAKGGPFLSTSEIVFEGVVIPTTYVNETTLTAVIPASALQAARQIPVQVRNRIGQSFSPTGSLIFSVGNPAPAVTGVTGIPIEIVVGHPGFSVTLTGIGFNEGGTVEVDGVARPYIFINSTQVRAFVGPADLAIGRIAKLTATNPIPTVGPSNATNITVLNPVAGLLSISPNSTTTKLEPNSPGLQLTVDGFSFKPGATITVQGFPPLNTIFVNSTRLIADIPRQALEVGGSFQVSVLNPPPTLGISEVQPLLVYNLIPQLSSIDVGALTFQSGPTESETKPISSVIVLHGSNFGKSNAVLWYQPTGPWPSCNGEDGVPSTLPATRISSTEIVTVAPIKCTGTFRIYVSSNQLEPGGGTSQVLSFTVTDPPQGLIPALTSLAPASTQRGVPLRLRINGENFLGGALVNFGTAILVPNSISTTAITVDIPAYLVQESGIVPVTVTNPGLGGTSTRLLFFVN